MSDIAARPVPGIADTLIFWEKGRVFYNAVLLVIVLPYIPTVIAFWPAILMFAFVANVLYCLAYPIDLLMQQTSFADGWLRVGRWVLLAAGTIVAAGLAASVMFGMPFFPAEFS